MDVPVVAVGVGLVGGYAASVVSGAGAATWKLIERRLSTWWTARSTRLAAEAAADAKAAEKAAASRAEAELRARLEAERVGATFLRRHTAEDPGTVVTVLELASDWRNKVLVEEAAHEGRPPPELDHQMWIRTSVDWRVLTLPDRDQRHATAHMVRSYDDADGWIEFERVT